MRVTVRPEVVSGTNKGGEDLFLVFEAKIRGWSTGDNFEGPVAIDPVDGDPSWDIEEVGDEDDPDNVWRCITGYYEHEWSGTLEDLKKIAIEAGVTDLSNWEWCGPVYEEPKRRFHIRHFVAGNAD